MNEQSESSPAVECRAVSIAYDRTPVVDAVDLTVAAGETVALLGPSGSGKTTLLYALAGFLPLAAGELWFAGRRVATVERSEPPERRPVAMVFQHYGLWPHLDALETVAYPLRRAGLPGSEARRRARGYLEQMHVEHLASRRPAELSGGEQQRVGLARALARRPALYLLDEPTAHLDTALRAELQDELASRRSVDGAAAIIATHDVEEALSLADRVVLLRAGSIVQSGSPTEVYERPVDEWAARLTGPASFIARDGATLMIRPEWVSPAGAVDAQVAAVRYRGSHTDYTLVTGDGQLLARWPGPPRHEVGAKLMVGLTSSYRIPAAGDR
jgi:ABC-type Fe3+/spermidine/putrescine transport system ATPase subunit